eukprot:UN08173
MGFILLNHGRASDTYTRIVVHKLVGAAIMLGAIGKLLQKWLFSGIVQFLLVDYLWAHPEFQTMHGPIINIQKLYISQLIYLWHFMSPLLIYYCIILIKSIMKITRMILKKTVLCQKMFRFYRIQVTLFLYKIKLCIIL